MRTIRSARSMRRCACRINCASTARDLRAEGRAPIEIRVGVNTGEVVVRSIQTGARHAEYTPIGHTTNLAARMQTIASTGSIVSARTPSESLAGYFMLKPLGPVKISGISDPVEVYRGRGLGPLRTRLQRSADARVVEIRWPRARNRDAQRRRRSGDPRGHGQSSPQWPMPVSASPASSMSSKRSQAPAPSCSTPIRSRTARPPPICPYRIAQRLFRDRPRRRSPPPP